MTDLQGEVSRGGANKNKALMFSGKQKNELAYACIILTVLMTRPPNPP